LGVFWALAIFDLLATGFSSFVVLLDCSTCSTASYRVPLISLAAGRQLSVVGI
jgi:hypothetical protein